MTDTSVYALPFKPGARVCELGGGERPLVRPNIDIRAMPTVDMVADFEKPLPMYTGEWDGVYSNFSIEHISWKRVRGFITEVHRILKPGGIAVFVTANLLEQCRRVVETPDALWNDDLPCMVFGGQGHEGDYHKCGWSPAYAIKMFKECGFYDAKVLPHPDAKTDMIIEGYKSAAQISTQL